MKLNIVTPRTGLVWVRTGLRTYFRQPLALTGLFFMYTTVVLLLAIVPGIGVVAGGMLVPAATLGLMAAAGGFEGITGVPNGFEYWSFGKSEDSETGFGYCFEPVLEHPKKSGLPRDEFLTKTQEFLLDAIDRQGLQDHAGGERQHFLGAAAQQRRHRLAAALRRLQACGACADNQDIAKRGAMAKPIRIRLCRCIAKARGFPDEKFVEHPFFG